MVNRSFSRQPEYTSDQHWLDECAEDYNHIQLYPQPPAVDRACVSTSQPIFSKWLEPPPLRPLPAVPALSASVDPQEFHHNCPIRHYASPGSLGQHGVHHTQPGAYIYDFNYNAAVHLMSPSTTNPYDQTQYLGASWLTFENSRCAPATNGLRVREYHADPGIQADTENLQYVFAQDTAPMPSLHSQWPNAAQLPSQRYYSPWPDCPAPQYHPPFLRDGFMEEPVMCDMSHSATIFPQAPTQHIASMDEPVAKDCPLSHPALTEASEVNCDPHRKVFRCKFPQCHSKTFGRHHELIRHCKCAHSDQFKNFEDFWCSVVGCGRSEAEGCRPFRRKDKRNDHERAVHNVERRGYGVRKKSTRTFRKPSRYRNPKEFL